MRAALFHLLGVDRIKELYYAYRSETLNKCAYPQLSSITLFYAVLVAALPAFSFFIKDLSVRIDITTVAVGIAVCLAVLFRLNTRLSIESIPDWRQALRLTHTAFAIGCIPIVAIVIAFPDSIYQVRDYVSAADGKSTGMPPVRSAIWFILSVSVWAGLTEEMIYRGMLVSALRRWHGFSQQWQRDLFAVTISSLMFGLVHLYSWGPLMSLALVGIGAGFSMAYIAIGERLSALIIYHILFDALSLSASFFARSG